MCVCTWRDKKWAAAAASEKFSIEQNKTIHHLASSLAQYHPPTRFIKHQVLLQECTHKKRGENIWNATLLGVKIIIFIVSSAGRDSPFFSLTASRGWCNNSRAALINSEGASLSLTEKRQIFASSGGASIVFAGAPFMLRHPCIRTQHPRSHPRGERQKSKKMIQNNINKLMRRWRHFICWQRVQPVTSTSQPHARGNFNTSTCSKIYPRKIYCMVYFNRTKVGNFEFIAALFF